MQHDRLTEWQLKWCGNVQVVFKCIFEILPNNQFFFYLFLFFLFGSRAAAFGLLLAFPVLSCDLKWMIWRRCPLPSRWLWMSMWIKFIFYVNVKCWQFILNNWIREDAHKGLSLVKQFAQALTADDIYYTYIKIHKKKITKNIIKNA